MRPKFKYVSILMLFLLAIQILPIQYMDFSWPYANAAETSPDETRNMSYTTSTVNGYQAVYSSAKAANTNPFTVTAPSGKVIKELAFYRDGVKVKTIDEAVGLSTWNTTGISFLGTPVDVESNHNDTAQGYFAWYRYAPNSPGRTLDWYQNGASGCSDHSGRDYTENVNGSLMPRSPNCSGAGLSLTANRSIPYTILNSNTQIPSTVVNASDITATASILDSVSVPGPEDVPAGFTDIASTHYVETKGITSDSYEVFYKQDLNYESDNVKQLGLPGAKVMVYYAAFEVNLKSKTYKYPDQIGITYENLSGPPNMGNINITLPSCVEVNQSTLFTFTFSNSGGSDVTTAFNVNVLIDGTTFKTFNYTGLAAGSSKTETFNKTFGGTSDYSVAIIIDSVPNETNTIDNSKSFTISPQSSCSGGGGGPEVITGTLSVRVPSIQFGTEIEHVDMKNVSVSGGANCQLASGTMYYVQGAVKWPHKLDQSGNFEDQFMATLYNGIGAGSVSVQYDIVTTCGTKKTIGPGGFEVTIKSAAPPVFQASWFNSAYYSGYNTPVTMIPIGETISFGLIRRPATSNDPGTPYDPNGAAVQYTTNIDTNTDPWINRLYSVRGYGIHDDHFDNVLADVKGSHVLSMSAINELGAVAPSQNIYISVVDPNPVPIMKLPPKVIEGRPYTPAFDCSGSFSPYKARSISKCDWHGTEKTVYPSAGDYDITLDVMDNTGLWSLAPDRKVLTVLADLPPVPTATFPSVGIKNTPISFQGNSYSPDGDVIVAHTTSITCDSNNNGTFSDDPVTNVTPDAQGRFTYTSNIVGNCNLHIFVKEDWGKSASKDFPFTIINRQPDADVGIFGQQPQPSIITPVNYNIKSLLDNNKFNSFTLDRQNFAPNYLYKATEGALLSPDMNQEAKVLGYQGSNGSMVVPYKAPTNSNVQATTLVTFTSSGVSLLTNTRISRLGWMGSGPMQPPSGFGVYNPWDTYGSYFFTENGQSGYSVPNGTGNLQNIYHLNNPNQRQACLGTPACGGDVEYHINPDADLYWIRIIPKNGVGDVWKQSGGCNWYATYYDYVYRISDVTRGASDTKSPMYTGTPTVYLASCSAPGGTPYQAPPSMWVEPVSMSNVMTIPSGTVPHYNSDNYTYSTYFVTHSEHTDDGWQTVTDARYLQKTDLAGNVIWRSPYSEPISNPWLNGSEMVRVLTVSSDGNKLVSNTLGIYDNNTGAYLGQSPKQNVYGSIDTYIDKVIENYGGTTYIYDLVTGGYVSFPSGGKITIDKKYVRADSSNLYVYSLESGGLLYSIPYTRSGNMTGVVTVNQVTVSEDGKALITLANSSYISIVSITSDPFVPDNSASAFDYGILTDKSQWMQNGTISVSLKFAKNYYTDTTGVGLVFRTQDNKNMYRAEVTSSYVSLVKIVNGVKTVLAKTSYPSLVGQYYPLMVKVKGTKITVSYNGVPVISINDGTFSSGRFGIFDELPSVFLKDLSASLYQDNSSILENVVLVGTSATYDKTYSDPDSDPAIPDLSKWTFTNVEPQKFLDAGDGYSEPVGSNSYVNYQSNNPLLIFNKVGVYKVDYQIPDDPAPPNHRYPDNMFASFRLYSDPVTKNVTVHRAPINMFTLDKNADGTITWNEAGYDPDRWLSPTNYSTEKAEFAVNHGVYQRKYSYTTPNGVYVEGKLVRPAMNGTYIVREVIADEFGAWSDWYEVSLNVDSIPVNNPPSVYLTFPAGTQSNPDYVNSLTPIITWYQTDPDPGTTFTQARVLIKDESGNTLVDRTYQQNTTSTTGQWQLDTSLVLGTKYQVQVMTQDDGGVWSPWSNIGWMITNRPPTAVMTVPNGTQAAPTIFDTTRPQFKWSQTDVDLNTVFSYFQIQVTNEKNTVMVLDSNAIVQNTTATTQTWNVPTDLPPGQKLRVRVRVHDGYVWSNWSDQTWFYVNRPPTADFDWMPKPAYEGDTLTLTNQSTDPDGDTPTSLWSFTDPSGVTTTSTTLNASINTFNKPGTWRVTLAVTDPYGASATVTKNISVGLLSIAGAVLHTTTWESNRKNYNVAVSGTQNSPWLPNMFLAGEVFMLSAETTAIDPLSADKATSVDVTFITTGDSVNLTSTNGTIWTGQLWDISYKNLDLYAPHSFRFHVHYSNGVDKYDTQTIMIYDGKTIDDYWLLKRDK